MTAKRAGIAAALVAAVGCGGGYGATPGGVQDIGLVRELIEAGRVPPPEAFVVEGMFSEHELGLDGPPCSQVLCLRGAIAQAPDLDGDTATWLQVGMSSSLTPETFERPRLSVIATVDVSGSMGWDYGNQLTPAWIALETLREIARSLGPGDEIAIVTYGSDVRTELPLTDAGDYERVFGAIDELGAGGSTDMESGLRRAFALAEDAANEQVRVMLFTDVQPNVGATSASEFERIAAAGAEAGAGLTVFGLGRGLGQEVMLGMSHLRGGNAFSLFDFDDIGQLMADDWPFLATPLAYDLELHVRDAEPETLYGFPAGADGEAGLEVSTVFLSRRRGALLVRLDGDGDGAEVSLRYQTLAGEQRDESLTNLAEQTRVRETTALALAVDGMREAARLYADGARPAAEDRAALVAERLEADAESLPALNLLREAELARALARLIAEGAPQGNLYP